MDTTTRYMLDNNICIELIRNAPETLVKRIAALPDEAVLLSTIVQAELETGVAKSSVPARNAEALQAFLSCFEIVPFDEAAAAWYGKIRAALESAGTPIGPLDTLIAAHAFAVDATLVTANEREFSRVRWLRIENWSG